MNTTTKKAAGVGAPTARKDRTSRYDHDHDLILPAITGIVTLVLLVLAYRATCMGNAIDAIIYITAAAAAVHHMRPLGMEGMERTHGDGDDAGRRMAPRHARSLRQSVHRRIQPGTCTRPVRRNENTATVRTMA